MTKLPTRYLYQQPGFILFFLCELLEKNPRVTSCMRQDINLIRVDMKIQSFRPVIIDMPDEEFNIDSKSFKSFANLKYA